MHNRMLHVVQYFKRYYGSSTALKLIFIENDCVEFIPIVVKCQSLI